MVTVSRLLNQSKQLFPASETARLDTEVLLGFVTQQTRSRLLAHPELELTDEQSGRWKELSTRRKNGEPVAYLLGEREFYSLPIKVTPATLIPRPETELLVDLALENIPDRGACTILELGTGSGAIACAIATERPDVSITATDKSEQALDIARENADRLGIGNTRFVRSDWFDLLERQKFDLVLSNPPYVAQGDNYLKIGDVRFEPGPALIAGVTGLDCFRAIIPDARDYLKPNGFLILEHGADQGRALEDLYATHGYEGIKTVRDLAGLERVTLAQRKGE